MYASQIQKTKLIANYLTPCFWNGNSTLRTASSILDRSINSFSLLLFPSNSFKALMTLTLISWIFQCWLHDLSFATTGNNIDAIQLRGLRMMIKLCESNKIKSSDIICQQTLQLIRPNKKLFETWKTDSRIFLIFN